MPGEERVMSRRYVKVGALVFVVCMLAVIMGCEGGRVIITDRPYQSDPSVIDNGPPPWAPAHGHRAKHQYHYYPSSYVYFDVGSRIYFSYDNGQWRVSASIPAGVTLYSGEHVVLEMDTEKPYEYHSEVVKRYPPGQRKKMNKGKKKY